MKAIYQIEIEIPDEIQDDGYNQAEDIAGQIRSRLSDLLWDYEEIINIRNSSIITIQ